jgi:hypothetical protein
MPNRDVLVSALTDRFADRGIRLGTPPAPIAVFPARHPEVGDVSVVETGSEWDLSVTVSVGSIVSDHFHSFDRHLGADERAARVTKDVVRFLEELFADRLLFWRSTDGGSAAWRERGDTGYSEPLVLDNRTYQPYLWSGPLAVWQAVPAIFGRGRIRDDREREILAILLEEGGPSELDDAERDVARRLVAEYERERET